MELFFKFLVGHALGDFVLQSETMAVYKNRHHRSTEGLELNESFPAWYYWLSSHALIHAGIVYLITGNWLFGLLELVLHWCTDYAKCEKWINFHQDQAIHIACKLAYVTLLWQF
jgi:hypothetical protein